MLNKNHYYFIPHKPSFYWPAFVFQNVHNGITSKCCQHKYYNEIPNKAQNLCLTVYHVSLCSTLPYGRKQTILQKNAGGSQSSFRDNLFTNHIDLYGKFTENFENLKVSNANKLGILILWFILTFLLIKNINYPWIMHINV